MSRLCVIVFSITFVAVTATPTNITGVGANCIITQFNQAASVVNSCTNIIVKNLVVDAGETLKLNLKTGATLTFEGTITFGYAQWAGPFIYITGNKITVVGAQGNKLDGQGARWWDGKVGTDNKKPNFMTIGATGGSVMKNINMYNCPHQCVDIAGSNGLTISNWNIDSSAGNPVNHKLRAVNTDGFDFAGTHNILLENIVVKNQDDCIGIIDGSNMRFTNLWCYGGHGLSIATGMSKTDYNRNIASNITRDRFTKRNPHKIESRWRKRKDDWNYLQKYPNVRCATKALAGQTLLSALMHERVMGITNYAINVEQNYRNNMGPSGQPNNNVPVDGLTISGISATMKGKLSMPVYILCASGGCFNFKWSNINIKGNAKPSKCNLHPSGFNC